MNIKLAKNAITKFCKEHYTGIVDAAAITIPIAANAILVGMAYHLYKKYPKIVNDSDIVESNDSDVVRKYVAKQYDTLRTVAGCDIICDDDIYFDVIGNMVDFGYAKQCVDESVEYIEKNGFAITEQGLKLMKAIIDNPVIVE